MVVLEGGCHLNKENEAEPPIVRHEKFNNLYSVQSNCEAFNHCINEPALLWRLLGLSRYPGYWTALTK